MTYDEWESGAAEFLGLEPWEAAELAEQLAASGVDFDRADDTSEAFWTAVIESPEYDVILEEELPDEEDYESPYELDPYFPDDEWLEPDIEWEMTAETEEGYGER